MTLESVAERLAAVLREAASIVTEVYAGVRSVQRKSDGSALTAADTRVDELLRARLGELWPAAWLSEETVDDLTRLEHEWVWIVDPLDGTKEFVQGLPEFAVSVGLVCEGRPVLGAVTNPATGELGVGVVGRDAHFWPAEPYRAPAASLSQAYASISRTELDDGSATELLPLVGSWRPVGSIAYKLLRVAAGTDDLTFSVQPKSEWDVCGGIALLEAVGKTYRRFDGEKLRFNCARSRIESGAVAGPSHLVSEFLAGARDRYPARSGMP